MATKKYVDAEKFLESLVGPLTLGKTIRSIRQGEGMKQDKFARLLKITKSHLSDIERDRKAVSPERAARFAKILAYSQQQFVRLALEGLLKKSGLKMKVIVKAA